MRFSAKARYGLRVLLILALREGEGSLSASQIAKKENLSIAYLEQIFNHLKKKGLIRSVRGPQGGYVLSKKPSDITLDEVLATLSGSPKGWVPELNELEPDADETEIGNFLFWQFFCEALESKLSGMTLRELIDQTRKAKKSKQRINYTFHI